MMFFKDLKYAIRLLSKKPGFTILTTLVMAAGIGLSTYMFVFFNTALFKDLPFEDSATLMVVSGSDNGVREFNSINLHDYYEIRTKVKGLSEFGAYINTTANVSGHDGARRYNAVLAEPNIFQITRTKPILGREFTNLENRKGAKNVVVIGYDLWQNSFAGDPKVIEKSLRINGKQHQIVGVMPQGYLFPNTAELWMPLQKDAAQIPRAETSQVYGLAHIDDISLVPKVNQQLSLIMKRLESQYPKTNSGISAYIDTLPMSAVEDGIPVVYSLQIAAIFILILAAINVGNLLLSRAVERGKETAIRMALGAPRSRLISQMLWESIIICTLGGLIGLFIMAWGLEVTERITDNFNFGKQVFWFKFGVDAFTLKLFFSFLLGAILITGVLPAWKNSGSDFNAALRDGTRGALGKKAGRLNKLLVISEIFISIAVLITASILITSAYIKTNIDYGVKTDKILTAQIKLAELTYDSPEKQVQFVQALQSSLENSPGISEAMFFTSLPGERATKAMIAIEGKEYTKEKGYPKANYVKVSLEALPKLRIDLKQGRFFNTTDEGLEKNSIIISESFAALHFPGESPIGKRVRVINNQQQSQWLTVIGVVEHIIHGGLTTTPLIYRPFSQEPEPMIKVALQMTQSSSTVVQSLRKALKSVDSEIPAYKVEPYTDKIKRFSAPIRFISKVFLLFGVAAVFLAASGIYGVMSNTVSQKTQEIGVKRALGAREQRITKEFLMLAFKQFLWGGIPGLLFGGTLGYAMSLVMDVNLDILIMISIGIVTSIGTVVMLATYLPTKRALKLEPSEALHYE